MDVYNLEPGDMNDREPGAFHAQCMSSDDMHCAWKAPGASGSNTVRNLSSVSCALTRTSSLSSVWSSTKLVCSRGTTPSLNVFLTPFPFFFPFGCLLKKKTGVGAESSYINRRDDRKLQEWNLSRKVQGVLCEDHLYTKEYCETLRPPFWDPHMITSSVPSTCDLPAEICVGLRDLQN